ncbi:hypothetical protein LCGC14_0716490 [marine sediment metagenome]|uniref:DOD-type homing endonuclease domain-containing protein n=1 Tax=marine sediment metagenome TaxID=412755 RepID=A0A0F9QYR4_9ZZZZ
MPESEKVVRLAKTGKASNARTQRAVKAIAFGVDPRDVTKVTVTDDSEPGRSKSTTEDPFDALASDGRIIEPPFDMLALAMLPERSTELLPVIEAMEINIEGFGHRLVPRVDLDKLDNGGGEASKEMRAAVNKEKTKLTNFFAYASLRDSFIAQRRKLRRDLESTGNAYWEVIESAAGVIHQLVHLPSYQMRLGVLDAEQVKVPVPILELQEDGSVKVKEVESWERFRPFVQSRAIQRQNLQFSGDHRTRWFKEFGDPRTYDNRTGMEVKGGDITKLPEVHRANAIIHFKLYSPRAPYGLPRFIGNLLSIFGDRAAEEINFTTFQNNNVPSMMLLVSNGQLTDDSLDRIKEHFEGLQSSDNRSTLLLIEGEGVELVDGGEDGGQIKIEAIPMVDSQHNDALFQAYSKNNQEKIRRAFRMPPILVGKCHSEDTEYLTDRGWLPYRVIEDGARLATLNRETGGLEYQIPTARHEYDHDGPLVHLRNRGVDALVTSNHNLWTRPTTASTHSPKPWRFVRVDELAHLRGGNGGYVELPVSAAWEGEDRQTFDIPAPDRKNARDPGKLTKNPIRDLARYESREGKRTVPMLAFLRFLGYFVAEGSTTETRGPIVLSQNRGEISDDMIAVLREIGFDPTVVESRPSQLNISVSHLGLWTWLRENCGTGSDTKKFPRWMLDLTPELIENALRCAVASDGHEPERGSPGAFAYSTTSKQLADQIHEIGLRLGYAVTSRVEHGEGRKPKWCLYAHAGRRHLLHPMRQAKLVDYQGKVSCFTVPNGTLVTRRNGRVLISGNSEDYNRNVAEASRKLADEQVFAPEREEFDAFINRRLFPVMKIVFHKFKSNSPNTTDNAELVKLIANSEKTGGMTPRIARGILEDILGIELPPFPKDFPLDVPFSLTMAEAVKNMADPTEPGQQVTALKTIDLITKLTEGTVSDEEEGEAIKLVAMAQRHLEKKFRQIRDQPPNPES